MVHHDETCGRYRGNPGGGLEGIYTRETPWICHRRYDKMKNTTVEVHTHGREDAERSNPTF